MTDKIWIITEEIAETSTTTSGSRSGGDIGGRIGGEITKVTEVVVTKRKMLEVAKLKEEMSGFLQAMREVLDEAEQPDSKMQLNEVELLVEINGEGQISLLGFGGGKAGGKGAMTFKFKRKG
ncbi:hypothetical protein [Calothrix sp. PCC 6303]|uniref:Pepco domain-containing protein n=1 Tax=Calothrix sp. PCC 6303 TaxID=1170562 RepID=UPI0002A03242|nr:hypothetical protein [Calothrix sp. PCC 6303]AFZ00549.1 hypothetical protein Cal6303_1502 [Calothrix sp. PCC 6303]